MKKILFSLPLLIILAAILFHPSDASSQESATSSSDEIREKVKDKIESVLNEPKAYIGTVTDKTEGSLQIKNSDGLIQLVSINSQEVSFVKVGKTTSTIKFGDLAIGDHVVAMGFSAVNGTPGVKNGNSVLEAKRVLVTEALQTPKREAIFGKVVVVGKKEATIVDKKQKEFKLEFPKRWKGPDLDELSPGDTIIAAGEVNGIIVSIRTIQVTSKSSPTPSPEE
ncbi:hypothetical protein A2714_02075 [Candidatus Woesebacteria bacterium RIFCSPHIGHO2_01_FULL_38_9]|uniref:DUF5666 domain-containing protein n=2 Tax=Candidatus Woeseibacteriota TaxID=1752722 RepID=A0A1F7Y1A8_9BACT|nr:MAG: hypothetical protein A2714_02075 [Candidatus Woesebacteria bacterium RIFCSPHIGHO2_01_FULL_38_9]OGM60183.1 MAG: hypothetical protein A3A75_05795 [Candidatus Woesebacteria bacterium RIFCSPLOWO2_01_FULL_39_10]